MACLLLHVQENGAFQDGGSADAGIACVLLDPLLRHFQAFIGAGLVLADRDGNPPSAVRISA